MAQKNPETHTRKGKVRGQPADGGVDQNVSSESEKNPLGLEDVLIALQKSFSRVSYQTERARRKGGKESENALALVTGPVTFTMQFPASPSGDRLAYDTKGELKLSLSGTIQPDIRITASEE